MKWEVERREFEGKELFLMKVGSLWFGEPDFLVWVSPKLVTQTAEDGCFLEIPAEGVELVRGKKDLIIRPGKRNLFNVIAPCGNCGDSEFEVLTPGEIFDYEVWSSRGNSRGALVITESSSVKFKWRRNGETYGAPREGFSIINIDGSRTDIEGNEEDALASLEE